jgi:hypothetical protein
MSKQTKIIAIVGGVLILVALGVLVKTGFFKGSGEAKTRSSVSVEEWKVIDCLKFGHGLKRDDKGVAKGNEKDPAVNCKAILGAKCKDANFKKANAPQCAKVAAPAEDKE